LLVLVIGFSLANPNFLQARNVFNTMRDVSIIGLIATGMTFVILTGGIDLSVGSLLALTGVVAAVVAKGGAATGFTAGGAQADAVPVILPILAATAVGLLGGLVQGLTIVTLKVPPFIVTLGGL